MNLHDGPAYGPTMTRRFGRALGVTLAPAGRSACNFACSYCTYGRSAPPPRSQWPAHTAVIAAVERALETCGDVDSIVVAGNGEPTLHPALAPIAEGLFQARARHAPNARLVLLSNGSTLGRLDVRYSLGRFDQRCMKLDAGDATTFRVMNGPALMLDRIVSELSRVKPLTLMSTFLRDDQCTMGNATPGALRAWLDVVQRIGPETVDLCTRRRDTRLPLRPVHEHTLQEIAGRVRALGIRARVFA
jgi:wyosine [tRNA(Phe)-imidazoG37] synthetase (radical SAM superfamily)